jgi:hypothetical protein
MEHAERVLVTAAIIRRFGAVLLARRRKASHLDGHWEFPAARSSWERQHRICWLESLWRSPVSQLLNNLAKFPPSSFENRRRFTPTVVSHPTPSAKVLFRI